MRRIATVALPLLTPLAAHAEAVQALSATNFLDSIGIGIHFPAEVQGGTTYNNTDTVIRELSYIGIHHVKGSINSDGATLARMQKMNSRLHTTWALVYALYKGGTTELIRASVKADQVLGRSIEAFEGANEPDWFGLQFDGLSGAEAVRAAQKAIYESVKHTPEFKNIPVYGPALSYPAGGGMEAAIGDLSAYCDFGSSHIYVGNFSLGKHLTYDALELWGSFGPKTIAVGRPRVITEAGWPTMPTIPEGIDEVTQAKYALEYVLDAFIQGFSRTYIYELAEEEPDPKNANSEWHFGFFRYDGTPKPAASAFANLNKLLSGSKVTPQTLSYSVTGLPANTGHQILLEKGDGTFVIGLWNEAYLWDGQKHERIAIPATKVEIKLETAAASVKIVDPLTGTQPSKILTNATDVNVTLEDHPLFVFVSNRK